MNIFLLSLPSPHHSHSCGIKLPTPQQQVIAHGVQSASPAVIVHRSMAGTARGIRVGYEINKERLHTSVLPQQTAPFQRCVNIHCTGVECLSSARGNTQSSRKARCRGSGPHRLRERLLQLLFSGAKERRRTSPNLGPETTELCAFKVLILHDYTETNPLPYQTGRLVYLCGFKLCLYIHIKVAPRHRRFLRFALEGIAYQFTVLPFGLCMAPRRLASLSPIWERADQATSLEFLLIFRA